jgi:hypothetical protein
MPPKKRRLENARKLEVSPSSTVEAPEGDLLSRTQKKIISHLILSENDPAFFFCWDDEAVEECMLAFAVNQIANIPPTPVFMGPEDTLSPRFISSENFLLICPHCRFLLISAL